VKNTDAKSVRVKMKPVKLKKNRATLYVLPGLIVIFASLIGISLLVDETTFLTCDEINQALLNEHNDMAWDMSDELHLKYHQKHESLNCVTIAP
jgi:hypothetical protein